MQATISRLNLGVRDLNSGPHADLASTLPTESPPYTVVLQTKSLTKSGAPQFDPAG